MDGHEQVGYDAAMHPHPSRPQTQAVTGPTQDDLAKLRREHPGWNFGTMWTSVNSGPDKRRIWASRNGVILSAWNAAALAEDIKREPADDLTREEET
jgi:hypothetical protein